MVTVLYEEEPLNPVSLEKALGLNRGAITSVTKYPEGAVEIEFATTPSTTLAANVKAELSKRGFPRGKKPKEA